MAKQRHSSHSSDGNDDVIMRDDNRHSIDTIVVKRNYSRTFFSVLGSLIIIVFVTNIFQFDFISNFSWSQGNADHLERNTVRKQYGSCEYSDGPVFFNLRTSMGVSYDAGHW